MAVTIELFSEEEKAIMNGERKTKNLELVEMIYDMMNRRSSRRLFRYARI
jgi:hypothetical protein